MKRVVRASKEEELVDLLAKTVDGQWVKIFENIPESQAVDIWHAGFVTGQNIFSIENETTRRVRAMNRKTLGLDKEE